MSGGPATPPNGPTVRPPRGGLAPVPCLPSPEAALTLIPAPLAASPCPARIQLAYDSLTGNVRRFTQTLQAQTGLDASDVRTASPTGPFLLLTYTFGSGEVPASTARFLERHAGGLRGVVVSGSVHWGQRFGRAGDLIAERYGVPLVARINKSGSLTDRETVRRWLDGQLDSHSNNQGTRS